MTDYTQRFADRLAQLERDGDVDSFVDALFAPDVVFLRPETGQRLTGHDGAQAFWQDYLASFARVASTFTRVSDGPVGILEWISTAQLRGGSDITYSGVSLLDLNADGLVTRFSTYYDTRTFQPGPLGHRP